ncbi:MAG: hypothetical protein AB7S26_37275 [Sandaracinaceae bacterium]
MARDLKRSRAMLLLIPVSLAALSLGIFTLTIHLDPRNRARDGLIDALETDLDPRRSSTILQHRFVAPRANLGPDHRR